jgi:Fic family protein
MITDPKSWSTIAYEERKWAVSPGGLVPNRVRRLEKLPYQAAIVPEIAKTARLDISNESLSLLVEASHEIARFDDELGIELAPFSAILLRSESVASSRIENLSASAKSISLAELGDPSRRNANIIVANVAAMRAAINLADQLNADAILATHKALLGNEHPDWAGKWRHEQVWIGGNDFSPHGAMFVPPHHSRVPVAIDDLVQFINGSDLPPLAVAAIAHAQFETIHPFPDGNGRVGRALIHSILKARGLTRHITVPVSAGLLVDLDQYFAALTDYRNGNHEHIVTLIANASFHAIANGRILSTDLGELRDDWFGKITARRDATVWELVDLILRHPIIDSDLVQRELDIAPHNANTAIQQLVDIGSLVKVSGNYRKRKWSAPLVLAALDRFATRAGRRQRHS